MKKIILTGVVLLNSILSLSQDAKAYYELINKGQKHLIENDLSSSLISYGDAFELFNYPFYKHIKQAALVALFNDNEKLLKKYLTKCVEKGMLRNELQYFINKDKSNVSKNILLEYGQLRTLFLESIDSTMLHHFMELDMLDSYSNPLSYKNDNESLETHRRQQVKIMNSYVNLIDSLGYPFCRGRIFDTVEQDTPAFNDTREIFWATGAAFFIRSKIYHELNGFEELFFAHMEEIDLCWRIRNRGLRIYYCGESTVYHLGGGTLNTLNPKKTYLNFRNGLGLLYRNLPAAQLFYKIPLRLILDGVAALKFLINGEFQHTLAILKAHFAFYRMTFKLKRAKRIYTNHTAILNKSLVWLYFVKKKTKFSDLKNQIS